MGKLLNNLKQQLKDNPNCEETKEVLKIYEAMLSIDGRVWNQEWSSLTRVTFIGKYPNSKRFYKPSPMYYVIKNIG